MTLSIEKLSQIEAAAAKATPVAWQLLTHKGLAETWIRLTPPIDDVEEYRPLYADCDPATVAALCREARRYRWLRDEASSAPDNIIRNVDPAKWDDAIDALLAEADEP